MYIYTIHKEAEFLDVIRTKVLKGHGNEPVFLMFLHKSLWPRSLTLTTFQAVPIGFEFSEIFEFENRLPASVSRGVDKTAWSIHFFQTFK
jgi:hypothetical protein